jgi:hypothetical protein
MKTSVVVASLAALFVAAVATGARADEAVVDVGPPPPSPPVRAYADPPILVATSPDSPPIASNLYRSPFRLSLGPIGATTGAGVGPGLGAAADFGRGTLGFRLTAAWVRGEPGGAQSPSPIADGLAQYTGEITLDLHKDGPWHPELGMGFGVAKVSRGETSGSVGIGTGAIRLEYALDFDDADVRIGAGVTGVMAGPSDREVSDVRSYALFGGGVGVGF